MADAQDEKCEQMAEAEGRIMIARKFRRALGSILRGALVIITFRLIFGDDPMLDSFLFGIIFSCVLSIFWPD
jgi:hypothetical protein